MTAVYERLDEPKKSSLAIFRHGKKCTACPVGSLLSPLHLSRLFSIFKSSNSKSSTSNEKYPKVPIRKDFLDKQVVAGLRYIPGVSCLYQHHKAPEFLPLIAFSRADFTLAAVNFLRSKKMAMELPRFTLYWLFDRDPSNGLL